MQLQSPIKDRISVVYVERGNLVVLDGAFVVIDRKGVRTYHLKKNFKRKLEHRLIKLSQRVPHEGSCAALEARPDVLHGRYDNKKPSPMGEGK